MGALISITDSAVARRTYLNSAASNVITNTTSETAFDQFYTTPTQFTGLRPNSLIRLYTSGVMSTALLNFGFTFRIRWGGASGTIIAQASGISVAASLTDNGWYCRSDVIIRSPSSSGTAETQSIAAFQAGAVGAVPIFMPNTGTFGIDTTIENDIVFTIQWANASASNSIQVRSMIAEIDTPPST